MIVTQMVALGLISGAGGSSPPPPIPTSPIGGGGRHRKSVIMKDGRRLEVENDDDLRRVVEAIIAERTAEAEEPQQKRKVSRKIRQRVKRQPIERQLSQINDWSLLYDRLMQQQFAIVNAQILLDLVRNTVLAELEDESEVELLVLLS